MKYEPGCYPPPRYRVKSQRILGWCIEELGAEPNPLDIYHILVPWTRDEESIKLQFDELTKPPADTDGSP